MKLLIRWAISAFSLFAAAWLVPGIYVADWGWAVFAVMAVILGLVNAIVRPLLKLLTCPLIVLTLGLFTLIINGFTLWFSAALANRLFGVGFYIEDFWSAVLGSLIVIIVIVILNPFLKDEDKKYTLLLRLHQVRSHHVIFPKMLSHAHVCALRHQRRPTDRLQQRGYIFAHDHTYLHTADGNRDRDRGAHGDLDTGADSHDHLHARANISADHGGFPHGDRQPHVGALAHRHEDTRDPDDRHQRVGPDRRGGCDRARTCHRHVQFLKRLQIHPRRRHRSSYALDVARCL